MASVKLKRMVFVFLFGSGHAISELVVSLLILGGALPAIILLVPDKSLTFYAGTWLLPALIAGKTVAEGKIIDQSCRAQSKKDILEKGAINLGSKTGVFVLGIALGLGWIGRKLWLKRKVESLQTEVKYVNR